MVRKVEDKGELFFANRIWRIGKAFMGQPVALRPTTDDGRYDVVFCQHKIAELDRRETGPRASPARSPPWVHGDTRAAASDSCGHAAARIPVDYGDDLSFECVHHVPEPLFTLSPVLIAPHRGNRAS